MAGVDGDADGEVVEVVGADVDFEGGADARETGGGEAECADGFCFG